MEIHYSFGRRDYDDAIKNLDQQDDRGAVIVVSTMLEETLRDAIITQFKNRDNEVEGLVLRGYGPLSTFRAKIDTGYLLGFYSKIAHTNFHRVREIRNRMAHKVINLSFEHQEIKDLCQHLPTQEEIRNSWSNIRDTVQFLLPEGREMPDFSSLDKALKALAYGKKPGDRGRFMTYSQSRLMSMRAICMYGMNTVSAILTSHHL